MPEKGIAPLSLLLYHASMHEASAERPPDGRKTVAGSIFFKVVKFAVQVLRPQTDGTALFTPPELPRRKRKPHPETVSGCG